MKVAHKVDKRSVPEMHFALDEAGSGYSQDSTHGVRERVGEGHCGSLLFVRYNGVFIYNLKKEKKIKLKLSFYPLKYHQSYLTALIYLKFQIKNAHL